MKITKYFIPIFLGLAVASCSDNEPQQSTAHKPGQDVEEPNKPEEPSSDPDDDVVSPTPSFNLTHKTKIYRKVFVFNPTKNRQKNELPQMNA